MGSAGARLFRGQGLTPAALFMPCLLGGVAGALCMQPWGWWPLVFVCAAPLLVAAQRQHPLLAAVSGLAWGTVQSAVLFSWLPDLLTTHMGFSRGPAIGLCVAGYIYQGLFTAIFTGWLSMARPGPWAMMLLAPPLWAGIEWLRGLVGLKLDWLPLGSALASWPPMAQTAELWGAAGLSVLVVLANALLAMALGPGMQRLRERALAVALLAVLLGGLAGQGQWRMDQVRRQCAELPRLAVMTAQSGLSITELDRAFQHTLDGLAHLTTDAFTADGMAPRLIVWPESAAPYYLFAEPGDGLVAKYLALENRTYLILGAWGAVERNRRLVQTNRVWLIDPWGEAKGFADKAYLAPFGEANPLGPLWPWPPLATGGPMIAPGAPGAVLDRGGLALGPLICFEAAVPDQARRQCLAGARLLVNPSNDAWFADDTVSSQVCQQLRMRALENRRSCARSANRGQSGFVLPDGSVYLTDRQVCRGQLPLMEGTTFFAGLGHLAGPLSLALGSIISLIMLLLERRRQS